MSLYKIEQRLLALGLNQEQAHEILGMIREFGIAATGRFRSFFRPGMGDQL